MCTCVRVCCVRFELLLLPTLSCSANGSLDHKLTSVKGPMATPTHSAAQCQGPPMLPGLICNSKCSASFSWLQRQLHLQGFIFLLDTSVLIFLYTTKESSPMLLTQLHNHSIVTQERINDWVLFDCSFD